MNLPTSRQSNADTLPVSPIALVIVVTVGLTTVLAMLAMIVLLWQEKDTGDLPGIVTGGTLALVGILAKTAQSQPIPVPTVEVNGGAQPPPYVVPGVEVRP